MFNYIKIRKKGSLNWKALREDGKILVFNRYENVQKYTNNLSGYVCQIMPIPYHPSHKKSPIYRKRYKKMEW